MKLHSTNNPNLRVTFKEALTKSMASDGGLFMPDYLPTLPNSFFDRLPEMSLAEIGFEISSTLFGDEFSASELQEVSESALNFDIPVVQVSESLYSLELYHGPTLAFKDVGARFMARLLGLVMKDESKEVTVLVATSGDTGSAVANGFLNVPGINVVILYPKGGVSPIQEKQLTTLQGNITSLEVDGVFDDCQQLVKQAFSDTSLNETLNLTSANSINVGRLIPQSFYYFSSYGALQHLKQPIIYSVPSGNYGNLSAGVIAQRMGLPIHHFIASSNSNDVVPRYLETGEYEPSPSVKTISNAMDVGKPNNFVRLQELFNHSLEQFRSSVSGYSVSDEETRSTMKRFERAYGYICDPHGAVAATGLQSYVAAHPFHGIGVFLECAHPVKFLEVVEETLGKKPTIPESVKETLSKEKHAVEISADYEAFKEFLIEKYKS